MSEQTREEASGSARAYYKGSDSYVTYDPTHWEALKQSWMAGRAFFEGTDLYGDVIIIKLADIGMIVRTTPAGLERHEDDIRIEDERQRERDITG